ncbi:LysR family transcriptional regulator [Trinickia fusca]|nr:LysR family transcriptional regulator [Trinickia fusca]
MRSYRRLMPPLAFDSMDTAKALSIFAAVVRAKSFTHAAQATGITPPAVSRSIALLEKHLGVRLFHRTTRRVSLTEEGEKLFELTDEGLRLLDEAMDKTRYLTRGLAGVIRITATRSINHCVLVPLIAAFREAHPAVRFDVTLDAQFTDLVAAKIDVGFRIGGEPPSLSVARPIGTLAFAVCASPAYLARHGTPATVDELLTHTCTGFRNPNTGRIDPWELMIDGELVHQHVPATIAFNDAPAELHAMCAGLGIGLLPYHLVADYLRAGLLEPVIREHWSEPGKIYLYYPQHQRMPARVRAFIDFALDWIKSHPLPELTSDAHAMHENRETARAARRNTRAAKSKTAGDVARAPRSTRAKKAHSGAIAVPRKRA